MSAHMCSDVMTAVMTGIPMIVHVMRIMAHSTVKGARVSAIMWFHVPVTSAVASVIIVSVTVNEHRVTLLVWTWIGRCAKVESKQD